MNLFNKLDLSEFFWKIQPFNFELLSVHSITMYDIGSLCRKIIEYNYYII